MSDYEDVQEFRARFEQLQQTAGILLGQSAMFAARLCCDFDDPETEYVSGQLADINRVLADVLDRLHELPSHLY